AARGPDAASGRPGPLTSTALTAAVVEAIAVHLELLAGDVGLHGLVVRHGPLVQAHVLRRDGLLLHDRTLLGEGDHHLLLEEGAAGTAVGGLALEDDLLALVGHLDALGVGDHVLAQAGTA